MEVKDVCKSFKIVHHYFENQLNSNLADLNLTRAQMDILFFLKRNERKNNEVNQKDIEKEFSLKNPTVTGILDRLEDKGYIKREVSSKDKRYKKILLTQSSQLILSDGRNHAKKIGEQLLEPLNADEKEDLKKLLDKIINNIKEETC